MYWTQCYKQKRDTGSIPVWVLVKIFNNFLIFVLLCVDFVLASADLRVSKQASNSQYKTSGRCFVFDHVDNCKCPSKIGGYRVLVNP